MLVLTRKPGETIHVGADVVITLVSIDRDRGCVRIGVDAPAAVAVHRGEHVVGGVVPPSRARAAAN